MPARIDQREALAAALNDFDGQPVASAGRNLFATLGYKSDRRISISSSRHFQNQLDPNSKLTSRERDTLDQVNSLDFMFQLTDAEIGLHGDMFDDPKKVQTTKIESYLFFAIELSSGHYSRTELATLVRAINKPLPMPALVLFRYGDKVSLGIVHRRLHKRDLSRDVLEKVTLIKDIDIADPIRAHLEILNDFAFANLDADFGVSNFVRLHEAWQKRLGSYALSNSFYREIADWYFWAHHQVDNGSIRLPQHCDTEQEKSLFLIRLLTRVIFCWFLVEKRLIPTDLFREHRLRSLLKQFNPRNDAKTRDAASTYYHAILQNLFFGTLNMPPEQRGFRAKKSVGERHDKNYGITNLWRYEDAFHAPADWLSLTARVPFLNGGLFDCLDDKNGSSANSLILDGFSDNPKLSCDLPNDLFFGIERTVDLSRDYGEEGKRSARSKKAKVRGLIEILSRYKFTIEENTPLEEEIALDPELLGKVFENLLASYNKDTRTTARKALGAFYTPREIVNYMVDEALKAHLGTQVPRCKGALDDLFSNKATLRDVPPDTRDALISAIGRARIIDPACGSGAFPMGALHRLVDLLKKLDPENKGWRELQRRRAVAETEEAFQSGDHELRQDRLKAINDTFEFNSSDYGRKLYLIENCIYGVDIQPVAVQIAKLRFFISLVVDQNVDTGAVNLGVRPLPNLETRLVAADALTPIVRDESNLFTREIDSLRKELALIRHGHFNARTPAIKRKWREADEAKRSEIAKFLENNHYLSHNSAHELAAWDPYDQNSSAPFFDAEWMFGLPIGKIGAPTKIPSTILGDMALGNEADGQTEFILSGSTEINTGFDIVLGNPPYVLLQAVGLKGHHLNAWRTRYVSAQYKVDLYQVFFEASLRLLRRDGILALITPNTFMKNKFSTALRKLLLTEAQPIAFLLFNYQVFPGQSVDNSVAILRKRGKPDLKALGSIRSAVINANADLLMPVRWRITPPGRIIPPNYELELDVDENAAALLDKIDTASVPLSMFCRAYFGIQTFDRTRFVAKNARNKHFHSVVDGTNVKRWVLSPPTEFVDFRPEAIKSGGDPSVYARDRIVVRQIGSFPEGCLCPANMLTLNTVYNIYEIATESRLRFYLGVLNSSIAKFYWRCRFSDNKETFPKIKKTPLLAIPVPKATNRQRDVIEQCVSYLLNVALQVESSGATQSSRDPLMLAYWERVLNGLMYELYFEEELHASGLRLFELLQQTAFMDLGSVAESDQMPRLRRLFESHYDGSHPLRVALDKLHTLDIVRVIESDGGA